MTIYGQAVADFIERHVRLMVQDAQHEIQLAVIAVGDDPASKVYVRNKERACARVGIKSKVIRVPENTSEEYLLAVIKTLNADDAVDGILVQLPLPKHIDVRTVMNAIRPVKDVDGLNAVSMGCLMVGDPIAHVPCTPAGIMTMLSFHHIPVEGRRVVIVGRSDIVGKPLAILMTQNNATVTLCHSHTQNLAEITRQADILVSAVGKPHFITADMVKPGATVIDVGINRTPEGRLVGDVDYDNVEPIASHITPVPGGVGLTTVASLLMNVANAAVIRRNAK